MQTNAAVNTIAAFEVTRAGRLTALPGSPFPTGGDGSGLMRASLPGLAVAGPYLLAANGGSGDISVFRVAGDGALHLAPGSPTRPRGGEAFGLVADAILRNVFVAGGPNASIDLMTIDSAGRLTPIDSLTLPEPIAGLAFEPSRS